MHRFLIAASIILSTLLGVYAGSAADTSAPILMKEVMSRETTLFIETGVYDIKEAVSKEITFFVPNGDTETIQETLSREMVILTNTDAPPPVISGVTVTLSPTGSEATLDWSSYNQWAIGDILRFDIYYSSEGPFNDITQPGLNKIAVPAGETSVVIEGLPEFTDHFFIIVPVDGLGNFDPAVSYSAGYVLSPEINSREVTFFVETGKRNLLLDDAVSREISVNVVSSDPPDPVTDPVISATGDGSTVTLDWSSYDQWSQEDIARFDIYYTSEGPFDTVPASGLSMISVPSGSTFVTIDGLIPFTDYYFAIVPVDGLDNFTPTIVYSASYVLSAQVISREISIFTGNENQTLYQQIISRPASVLTPDATVPEAVTGIDSGFYAETSTDQFSAVLLDWTSYDEPSQLDVLQYSIYVSPVYFEDVQDMTPFAVVPAGTQQYTLTGLTGGAILYFAVVAEDALGNFDATVRAFSTKVSVSGVGEVTGLQVQSTSDSLTFTWETPEEAGAFLSHYLVYFAGSTEGEIVAPDQTSWSATGLSDAAGYPFKITTVDVFGNESSGNSVIGATWLPNPANVRLTATGSDVILVWDAVQPVDLLQYYSVYRETTPITNISELSPFATLSATQKVLGSVSNVTGFYFAVSAVNLSGGQDPSVTSVSGTKASQTVTFSEPVPGALTIPLTASADSGLPVRFTSSDPSIASIAGATLEVHQGGTVTITAIQDGDAAYWPAQVSYTLRLPPVITGVTADGNLLAGGFSFTRPVVEIAVTASDADGIADFNLYGRPSGGTWTLLSSDSIPENGLTGTIPVSSLADGSYDIRISVSSGSGHSTETTYTGTLALAAPATPRITQPVSGLTSNSRTLTVAGTTDAGVTQVNAYLNGQPAGTLDVSSLQFSGTLTLSDGSNELRVEARNRAGTSPLSDPVLITLDRTIPPAPENFIAQGKEMGQILLNWDNATGSSVDHYDVYRATAEFSDIATAAKINAEPVSASVYEDMPGSDGTYYYRVVAVSAAGNQSAPSRIAGAAADSVPPKALNISYLPQGAYDPATLRYGTGPVIIEVTVSEALLTTPFLTLTPHQGVPVSIELAQTDTLAYQGTLEIHAGTPSGSALAVFSARDLVGNRGTDIDAGTGILIDTDGPAVASLSTTPAAPIQNDAADPVTVTVDLQLTENVKTGETPSLTYHLSQSRPDPSTITLTRTGDRIWNGSLVLPAQAGETSVESLIFAYQARDDLENTGTLIQGASSIQVYQDQLPPLDVPSGFTGKALPDGKVHLEWEMVAGASDYEIFRRLPENSDFTAIARSGGTLTYQDTPTEDRAYIYAVASVRTANGQESVSDLSPPVAITTDRVPPEAPSGLTLNLLSTGIQAQWQPPSGELPASYRLYRSDLTEIASTQGLSPVLADIETTEALDSTPSSLTPTYAVTAVDEAGNESAPSASAYLNAALLPVSPMEITQQDDEFAELTWGHPNPGDVAGYDLYIGEGVGRLKINTQSLLTDTGYIDTGYTGKTRVYTVTAVDGNGAQSLERSLVLPEIQITPDPGNKVQRGCFNPVTYQVDNLSGQQIQNAVLSVTLSGHTHDSDPFSLDAGETGVVPLVIAGNPDLDDVSEHAASLQIIPNPMEKVQIIRTGTLNIGSTSLPVELSFQNMIRGGAGQIRFAVNNTSQTDIEIITAESNGASASSDIQLTLQDEDGNTLSTGTYLQFTGDQVTTLANGTTIARIAPGDRFESAWTQITIPEAAPDAVWINLMIDHFYYHFGQADQSAIQVGSTVSEAALSDVTYTGEILDIQPAISYGGQDIQIIGKAVSTETGLAVPYAPLKLIFSNNGFERTFDIETEGDGGFTFIYPPASTDGGTNRVSLIHPDLLDRPEQGSFTIGAAGVTPDHIKLNMPRNHLQEIDLTVQAEAGTDLHNVQLKFLDVDQETGVLPQGITISLPSPADIGPDESQILTPAVNADNTAADAGLIVLRMVAGESGETPLSLVRIEYTLTDAGPVLSAAPTVVETGVVLDRTATESILISNKGFIDATEVTADLRTTDGQPLPQWIFISSNTSIGRMSVGDEKQLVLDIQPDHTVAEKTWQFSLNVHSAELDTLEIPVYVHVTQSGVGSALFHISDIYTATLDKNGDPIPGLANAAVELRHETVSGIDLSGSTDTAGEILFSNLAAGSYRYRITAPSHIQKIGRIDIKPGITVSREVFLDYSLVSVEWEVNEITLEDRYGIVLNAVYETDVPAPVVIVEPTSVTLPAIKAGEVFRGEMTVTNYGLVQAEDVVLSLPESDETYLFEFMATLPEILPAKSHYIIPYRVVKLKDPSAEDGTGGGINDDCIKCAWVDYCYWCANEKRSCGKAPVCWILNDSNCFSTASGEPAVIVVSSNGDGGGSSSIDINPAEFEDCECQDETRPTCEPCEKLVCIGGVKWVCQADPDKNGQACNSDPKKSCYVCNDGACKRSDKDCSPQPGPPVTYSIEIIPSPLVEGLNKITGTALLFIPVINNLTITPTAKGSHKEGEECCEDCENPISMPFQEDTLSIGLTVDASVGAGLKPQIQSLGFGYYAKLSLPSVAVGIKGTGEGKYQEKDTACEGENCNTLSFSATATPYGQISITASGAITSLKDGCSDSNNEECHKVEAGFTGGFTGSVETSIGGTYSTKWGENCTGTSCKIQFGGAALNGSVMIEYEIPFIKAGVEAVSVNYVLAPPFNIPCDDL